MQIYVSAVEYFKYISLILSTLLYFKSVLIFLRVTFYQFPCGIEKALPLR